MFLCLGWMFNKSHQDRNASGVRNSCFQQGPFHDWEGIPRNSPPWGGEWGKPLPRLQGVEYSHRQAAFEKYPRDVAFPMESLGIPRPVRILQQQKFSKILNFDLVLI